MRLAFQLLTLGLLVGACAAPTDTGKEVAEVAEELSLSDQVKSVVENDNVDALKALISSATLPVCDLALRDSELRACTVLQLACGSGAIDCVRYLLDEQKVSPNYLDRSGWTPLMRATHNEQEEVATLLLAHGADVALTADILAQTALHKAAQHDSTVNTANVLHAGAVIDSRDANGETPLNYAARFGKLANAGIIVRANASKNVQNRLGQTPLHQAIWFEKKAITAYLLAQGADVNMADKKSNMPLHLAAKIGLFDEVQLLLFYGADSSLLNHEGKKAEDLAGSEAIKSYIQQFNGKKALYAHICEVFRNDQQDALAALLADKGIVDLDALIAEFGSSAVSEIHPAPPSFLHLAVYYGAERCCSMLIKDNICQVDYPYQAGTSALQWAIDFGKENIAQLLRERGAAAVGENQSRASMSLLAAAVSGQLSQVQQLLMDGSSALEKDSDGLYPLLASILYGNTAVTAYILASGVDLKDCGPECLQKAAARGLLSEVKLLLAYKVDSATLDTKAIVSRSVSEYLVAYEERKRDCGKLMQALAADTSAVLEKLLQKNTLAYWDGLSREFEAEGSVLNLALRERAFQSTEFLLTHYEIPLNSERASNVPLCQIISTDRDSDTPELINQFVTLLLSKGAAIDFQDSLGGSALFSAGFSDNDGFANVLLAHGADPNLFDLNHYTALYRATIDRHNTVVRALLQDRRTNPDIAAFNGVYPVYMASNMGNVQALKFLLEAGAKTYQKEYADKVPLIEAVRFGSYACVKLLLDHGADRTLRDGAEKTALDYAKEIPGNSRLVALLEGLSS